MLPGVMSDKNAVIILAAFFRHSHCKSEHLLWIFYIISILVDPTFSFYQGFCNLTRKTEVAV